MPKSIKILILAALTLSLAAGQSFAQQVYATIHGTVTDSSGAVVPGATVTALNTATGISLIATTDSRGYYVFPQLHIGGPYTIDITRPGFEKFESTGLVLVLNDNRDLDAKLRIGQSSETVEVQASDVAVETSDTQLKAEISGTQITQLPLLGRDASQLEKTAPGVVESSDRFGSFSSNGSQTTNNSFLLDGADFGDGPLQDQGVLINPDALAEVDFITSTLNPEFARNAGAIVNETIKSGSNSIHGNGFYFYRDTFLNNGDYFAQQRPPFHQNLYGGTLGGPVVKNKLFFFLGYQGYRNRTGATQRTPVLNASQLAGNFSADGSGAGFSTNPIPFTIGGCVANGVNTWASCFPTAQIAPTNFNSIATNLVNKYVPAANVVSGGTSFYSFATANTEAEDQGIVRLDYHLSQNDSLWASSLFESRPSLDTLSFGGSSLPGFGQDAAAHTKVFNGSYTHAFNTTTLNELRANYFRFNYADVEPVHVALPSSAGFDINPQNPASGLPLINITGYFSLGFSNEGPQPRKDTNLSITDSFSKVYKAHNLKFGAIWEQFRVSNPYAANNNGNFGFQGAGPFSSGDPLVDFFLGVPDTYAQGSGGFIDALAYEYYAYAQDNWKVSSDFTLNYGISWDAETPNANRQYGGIGITCWQASNAESTIFPGAPPGLLYPGDPGCNKYGSATPKYDHFGPRIGFAWSPSTGPAMLLGSSGAHNLSIRGGFGIYYNRDQEEGQLQNLSSPPFVKTTQGAGDLGLNPGFANPFADVAGRGSEANPFPYTTPKPGAQINWANYPALELNAIASNYNVPYSYNFNLNVQRALPGHMVLTIGYVGSLGHNLVRTFEGDPITAAGHAACLANPACVASKATIHLNFPQYTTQPATNASGVPYYLTVGTQATNGASNYNSLQINLQKAISHGLFFNIAYTYSHALDNASGLESSGFNGIGTIDEGPNGFNGVGTNNVPGFQFLTYGDSDFDARHRFIAYYDYEVPLLPSMNDNRIVSEALGGWHLSGITTLQTGFPVGVDQYGSYNSLWCDAFSYYACPDVPNTSSFNIKSQNPRAPGHFWFDNSVFSSEPIGTFGNVKRNFFHGPGYNYTNLNLYKNFPISSEKARYLQIRLEAYNAFNHANFGLPDGNFSDGPSLFGSITAVDQPAEPGQDPNPGRSVQLAAKFYF